MSRHYDPKLVETIRKKQYESFFNGVRVTMKPIPDCDIAGAMDTRLLAQQQKGANRIIAQLTRLIPERFSIPQLSRAVVQTMRIPFDSVDSVDITTHALNEQEILIASHDGHPICLKTFAPQKPQTDAPILYFIHGGAFFAGHTSVIADAMRLLVENTNIIVVSVEYRLAPEHKYPLGHLDTYEGLKWVYEHAKELGGSPDKIVVGGDSAGGNLALYCANRNIEESKTMICAQILLYPTVNMANYRDAYNPYDLESIPVYKPHEHFIVPLLRGYRGAMPVMSKLLGVSQVDSKYVSPYVAVSEALPPTYMASGEHDYLTLESLALAAKMRDKGIHVQYALYKGMQHAFIDRIGYWPQAEDCVIDMGIFIREQTENMLE